jgi:hypothetical protein
MRGMTPRLLSTGQIQHFIERGYVVVPGCFSRALAEEMTDRAYARLGYDKHDRSTWKASRVHMSLDRTEDLRTFAPRAYQACADLVGGAERIRDPMNIFVEGFIVNFNDGADRPWEPPSSRVPGWHKDGNWFLHFLDSPEQGLLMIFLYSDIEHQGGGTFIAPDSVGVVSRWLARHREGVDPHAFPCAELIGQCQQFEEMTGRAGDVILMHPYMLHAISQNHSQRVRFITNPALSLKEPMNFNRENPADFSPVELGVLRGLGVDRLDFRPTAERRRIVSDQQKMQDKLKEEEKRNLDGRR